MLSSGGGGDVAIVTVVVVVVVNHYHHHYLQMFQILYFKILKKYISLFSIAQFLLVQMGQKFMFPYLKCLQLNYIM